MFHHAPRVRTPAAALALAVACAALAGCPRPPEDLDAFIPLQMEKAHVPGLAACIVKGGDVVWSGGYGWADIENHRPATPDTLFMIASVSKTVTATALMQLYEQGLLDLDDDVNPYLPFPVRNPNHPDDPITFRMLLTHTASVRDAVLLLDRMYTAGDSPVALGDFLRDYLAPGGQYYSAARHYYAYAPGEEYHYSNIGMTLIGYLVERISGMPFDAYCNDHIFAPLGLDETRWFLADLDVDRIAVPYRYRTVGNDFRPYAHYGYPDYPDGQLRTSVLQFARFLGAMLGGGEWKGARILRPETLDEMLTVPFPETAPNQAHAWGTAEFDEVRRYAHSGGDRGVTTDVLFIPEEGVAVAVFTNGEFKGRHGAKAFAAIEKRLLEEAELY